MRKKPDNRPIIERLNEALLLKNLSLISIPPKTINSKIILECNICHHIWKIESYSILRTDSKSSGCPKCATKITKDKNLIKGFQNFIDFCNSLNYKLLSEYTGAFDKVLLSCEFNHQFSISPNNLKHSKQRCPICSNTVQDLNVNQTINEYIQDTTWVLTDSSDIITKTTKEFICIECQKIKTLEWNSLCKVRKEELKIRECDCQRYGKEFLKYLEDYPDYQLLTSYIASIKPVLMKHLKCGTEWNVLPHNFIKPNYPTRCPTCARSGRASRGQLEVASFLQNELNINIEENKRGLDLTNIRSEVDIYCPDYQVAIEFDGVWWHAEGKVRDRSGQSRASAQPDVIQDKLFNLGNNNIRLIRIFSDEWMEKKSIIKSRLKTVFNQTPIKLNARSLDLDTNVPIKEALSFLESNHLQGKVNAQSHVAIGLRKEKILQAVMTFGIRSLRGSKTTSNCIELLRFCSLTDVHIRGGASRLLTTFFKNYKCDEDLLISYADLRYTSLIDLSVYEQLGFERISIIKPSYSYIHPSQSNRRISRLSLQKYKILQLYPDLDPKLTEFELTEQLGYARVWDSGQLKFQLSIKK
jgi:hypothetical protein